MTKTETTRLDLVREVLGEVGNEQASHLLWDQTAFPMHDPKGIREQLVQLRDVGPLTERGRRVKWTTAVKGGFWLWVPSWACGGHCAYCGANQGERCRDLNHPDRLLKYPHPIRDQRISP